MGGHLPPLVEGRIHKHKSIRYVPRCFAVDLPSLLGWRGGCVNAASHVCVGLLRVLRFPPTHAGELCMFGLYWINQLE